MKKNLVILLLMLSTFAAGARTPAGHDVDPAIENQFRKNFGPSLKVSWEVIQDISIATFVEQGEERHVYCSGDGEILGLGRTVSRDQLPEITRRAIHTRFPSAVIATVYGFKAADSPTRYFVRLATLRYSIVVSASEFDDIEVKQRERSR